MKILIGGSPCTHWSIAQTKNRETEASGIGWELFLNYRIARDKYQPDFFLYENNKSMSPAIREQITEELGVEPVLINSALVSAQNRQRLYWAGKRNQDGTYSQVAVEQPVDRGILLRDILESGVCWREKAYTLKANHANAGAVNGVDGGHFPATMAAEPVRIGTIENDAKNQAFDSQQYRVYSPDGKAVTLCGNGGGLGAKTGLYAVPVPEPVNETVDGKAQCLRATYYKDGIRNLVGNTVDRKTCVAIPVPAAGRMSHFTGLTEEPVEVLSMYDGMSCGHIALDKLGAEITAYYATEIDKYAVQTTQHNYPDTMQLGDAFQVRAEDWHLPEPAEMEAKE